MRNIIAVVLGLLAATTAREAAAADRPVQHPPEGVIVIQQGLAGFGVSLGGLALTGVAGMVPPLSAASALGTPYVVGRTVCAIGRRSEHHEGSCTGAIVGAYAGWLSSIPLAVIGYQLDHGGDGDEFLDGVLGALAGIAVGWLVVQPLAATVGWHMSKQVRLQPVAAMAPPSRLRSFAPPVPGHGRGRAPGQLALTLLSAGF